MTWIIFSMFIAVLFLLAAVAYIADKVATMLDLLRVVSDQLEELKSERRQRR